MRLFVIAAVLAVAAAPAALAQPAAASPEPAVAPSLEDADPDRKICKRITATGSRLKGYRVCKKAKDWDKEQQDARKTAEQHQRSIRPQPAG